MNSLPKLPMPHTLFGDTAWSDAAIQADVLVAGGHVAIGSRFADRKKLGWHLALTRDGQWQLYWQEIERPKGTLTSFDASRCTSSAWKPTARASAPSSTARKSPKSPATHPPKAWPI